jgi:hypothetical protein
VETRQASIASQLPGTNANLSNNPGWSVFNVIHRTDRFVLSSFNSIFPDHLLDFHKLAVTALHRYIWVG